MVREPRRVSLGLSRPQLRAVCKTLGGCLAGLMVGLLGAAEGWAQPAGVHYLHSDRSAPGAIGSTQLRRGGPLQGVFQPVEFQGPPGLQVAVAVEGQFTDPAPAPTKVGLQVGALYRLRVTNIPLREGVELFPTVELIGRLHPPPGLAWKFPIPIAMTAQDLELALEGKFVTRVIYLEDPQQALPVREQPGDQRFLDAGPGANPVQVADLLGRPVAILRIGNRGPVENGVTDPHFFGTGAGILTHQPPQTGPIPPQPPGPPQGVPPQGLPSAAVAPASAAVPRSAGR